MKPGRHLISNALLVSLGIGLIALVFYQPYRVVRQSTLDSLDAQQRLLARQAAQGLEEFFRHYEKVLATLAHDPSIIDLDDAGREKLRDFYAFNHDEISAVTRVDAGGRIIHTVPFRADAIGRDVSGLSHNQAVMASHRPVVSDVFTAVQGYETIALAVPVFKEKRYDGCLTILVPFAELARRHLAGIVLGSEGYAWMLSRNGVELYCPVPGHVGKRIAETSGRFPSVMDLAGRMMRGEQGRAVYSYDRIRNERVETVRKRAVYYPVTLPGNRWSVVVATPESQALAAVRDFGLLWLVLFLLTAAGLCYLIPFVLRVRLEKREERLRRRAEEKLRRRERLLSRFINNAHIPVAIVKLSGEIEFLNDKLQELCGYTLEDIPTMDAWFDRAYPDGETRREISAAWREKLREATATGAAVTFSERKIRCKDGSFREVVFGYTLIDDRIVITLNDNTEKNKLARLEHELLHKQEKAKKMEAIGLMAGGVAHDLNNILSGIVSYPELLLMQLPEDSPLRGPIKAIQEAGMRAAAVVADLLTVARGVATSKETADLNDLVGEYLASPEHAKLRADQPGVEYVARLEAGEAWILCSPVHIKKCLMNLVNNAAEAIGAAGRVIISTRNQYLSEDPGRENRIEPGLFVVLRVEDTGPGIPDKDIEHVFEPFYTKKVMGKSGTGLGLAVVWNTVMDHRGAVTVANGDTGAVFDLYFPVSATAPAPAREEGLTEDLKGNGETVLVVDDDPRQREITSQIVVSLGYKVLCAASGEEAVDIVSRRPVDVVVLDMIMPPGMGGRQTYERLLAIRPGQKAVVVSGFSRDEDVARTLKLGAGAFVQKPYGMETLARALKKVGVKSLLDSSGGH